MPTGFVLDEMDSHCLRESRRMDVVEPVAQSLLMTRNLMLLILWRSNRYDVEWERLQQMVSDTVHSPQSEHLVLYSAIIKLVKLIYVQFREECTLCRGTRYCSVRNEADIVGLESVSGCVVDGGLVKLSQRPHILSNFVSRLFLFVD